MNDFNIFQDKQERTVVDISGKTVLVDKTNPLQVSGAIKAIQKNSRFLNKAKGLITLAKWFRYQNFILVKSANILYCLQINKNLSNIIKINLSTINNLSSQNLIQKAYK